MFPIRSKQHVSESRSMEILQSQLPSEWVVRNVSERDYGIDLVIELDRGGKMVGDMIVAQLKSSARIPFKGRKGIYKGLREETLNYLIAQPAPAYLFMVSLSDRKVLWRSLREHDRERKGKIAANAIELRDYLDLSASGVSIIQISHLKEKAWSRVETAIMSALMFYNMLGPLYLACARLSPGSEIPSSIQQIIISHFEYNSLIQRYVMSNKKRYPPLNTLYIEAFTSHKLSSNYRFTKEFAIRFLKLFIDDYLEGIRFCDRMVRVEQRRYWTKNHSHQIFHFDNFPPYFVDEDWYSRYYFDEYESETSHINLDFFTDIPDGTRHDFQLFMNRDDKNTFVF